MDWCYVQIPETMASDIRQKSADQFQGKERIKQTHSRWWASGNFTIINAKNNLWTFQFQPSQNRKKIKSLINSCFGGGTSNSYIQQILNDPACNQLTKESNVFWILARSVKDFIEQDNDGWSPLAGTIPDMIADTQNYINLQNVYRQKALDDADLVYKRAQQNSQELNLPSELITDKDVKLFCREFSTIAVLKGTCIADEYEKPSVSVVASVIENSNSLMMIYVVLRALGKFESEHCTLPGDIYVESDTARIKSIAYEFLNE